MKRSLFNHQAIENCDHIGFDLDGTLYDEFDFIKQAYKEVLVQQDELIPAEYLKQAYEFMCHRWLEKGSSYPYIFSDGGDEYF